MTKIPKTTKAAAQIDVAPKAAAPKSAKAEAPPKGTKVEQQKAGQKPNALQQPLQPSPELAAVVGEGTMPRGEVVSKVWVYIKAHKLQSPDDGRVFVADDKLRKVFGKDQATMFEMNKLLAQHLK
jgi:upstream activation factor subunit UAF30